MSKRTTLTSLILAELESGPRSVDDLAAVVLAPAKKVKMRLLSLQAYDKVRYSSVLKTWGLNRDYKPVLSPKAVMKTHTPNVEGLKPTPGAYRPDIMSSVYVPPVELPRRN